MKKREERRYLTWKHATRQYNIRIKSFYNGIVNINRQDKLDTLHPGYYKKRTAFTHPCGKRRHGNPKSGYGCHCTLREAVRDRIDAKRVCKSWLRETPEDWNDVAL